MERRKRRNREALVDAAYQVMAEKGVDGATMSEIAEAADMGAGTAYNYFSSKDELAVAVVEQAMTLLAERIEAVNRTFKDPAQCYAFGIRTVIAAAITDKRWKSLLRRSEVIAGAMYRVMGPYAIRDLRKAIAAGRYHIESPDLTWRMATHAIVGFALAVCEHELAEDRADEAAVNLLGMAGLPRNEAWEIIRRPRPALPEEFLVQRRRPASG